MVSIAAGIVSKSFENKTVGIQKNHSSPVRTTEIRNTQGHWQILE